MKKPANDRSKSGIKAPAVTRKNPIAKYRGIGNRGIGSGRKAINRWLREVRGR